MEAITINQCRKIQRHQFEHFDGSCVLKTEHSIFIACKWNEINSAFSESHFEGKKKTCPTPYVSMTHSVSPCPTPCIPMPHSVTPYTTPCCIAMCPRPTTHASTLHFDVQLVLSCRVHSCPPSCLVDSDVTMVGWQWYDHGWLTVIWRWLADSDMTMVSWQWYDRWLADSDMTLVSWQWYDHGWLTVIWPMVSWQWYDHGWLTVIWPWLADSDMTVVSWQWYDGG